MVNYTAGSLFYVVVLIKRRILPVSLLLVAENDIIEDGFAHAQQRHHLVTGERTVTKVLANSKH